jgi:hypothetical protein
MTEIDFEVIRATFAPLRAYAQRIHKKAKLKKFAFNFGQGNSE